MAKKSNRNDWGVLEMAREKPLAATAAAAGAAAAGLFLWSKRAQIGEQINALSDQIGEWKANYGGDGTTGLPTGVATETGTGTSTGTGNPTGRSSRNRARTRPAA